VHLQIDSTLDQNERAEEVARQLRSIGGSTSIGFGENRVRSLPDAVGRALELHIAQLSGAADETPAANGANGANGLHGVAPIAIAVNGAAHGKPLARITTNGNLCPQCGNSTMYYEEGCKKCVSCGYSEC